MTKTLTEQWRDGTLPSGEYYIKLDDGSFATDKYFGKSGGFAEEIPVEVLAPVPSYSECQALENNCEIISAFWKGAKEKISQLEKRLEVSEKAHYRTLEQLRIATKALEYYTLEDAYVSCYGNPVNPNPMVARKALKEMEGVK